MDSKFIVIEWLDGSGKTTQLNIIADRLEKRLIKTHRTAEPTKNTYGKLCREYLSGKPAPKTLCAAVFTADRIDHNTDPDDGINAHLNRGETVLCDRYYYSTLAYQGVDVGMEWLKNLNLGCEDIRKPDLCIFLDLKPEISMQRINTARSSDDIEIYENIPYLTDIRSRFYEVINILKDSENIKIIDASKTIDEVADDIETEILKLYGI